MRKLSDYKDDEALDLWMDLLDPLTVILTDEKVREVIKSGQPRIAIAKELLKLHKKETVEIMLRIDPEPIDGINIILRLVALLADIGSVKEIRDFFGYAAEAKTSEESSSLPTENTGASER